MLSAIVFRACVDTVGFTEVYCFGDMTSLLDYCSSCFSEGCVFHLMSKMCCWFCLETDKDYEDKVFGR